MFQSHEAGGNHISPLQLSIPEIQGHCQTLTLLPNEKCATAHPQEVTDCMLCAGHLEGGKDTCVVSQPAPPHPQPPGLEVLGAGAQILRWGSELSRQPSPSLRSCSLLPPFLPVAPTSTHIRVHAFLPLTHISGPVRESLGRGELEGGRVL